MVTKPRLERCEECFLADAVRSGTKLIRIVNNFPTPYTTEEALAHLADRCTCSTPDTPTGEKP